MVQLKHEFGSLNIELEGSRKKEKDEVIVLSTAPLYMLIPPPFGQIIIAGVLVGVGADLGILREKIKGLVTKVEALDAQLGAKEKFMASYTMMRDHTQKTADEINKVIGAVAKIKDAWSAISSDLTKLVETLKGGHTQAVDADWFNAVIGLEVAKRQWAALADIANRFRLNATIQQAPTVDALMNGVRQAAA